ncbi:VOC family protein [Aestuariivivens insulae]|uniref:VOC family protein n=1 Tax=Aestuariivivens insulae TaxID=1621988 RepID=UPI001F5A0A75|nr:VOC family protein [Aestuariivivens insulae]
MLIKQIIWFTNNLQQQKYFYRDVLDFELVFSSEERIDFNVGNSILTFQYKESFNASHMAFNIPSNKINEALEWLQKKVEILTCENKLIANFESWNAEAVYFYDADKNIIEFIARKDLNVNTEDSFSSKSILSISEIAIATNNIESIYNAITKMKPIPIYSGDMSRFCALGNEEGLFIVINKSRKKWYPTQDEAYTSDFIIKGDYNFYFKDGEIKKISINT